MKTLFILTISFIAVSALATNFINSNAVTTNDFVGSYAISSGTNIDAKTINTNTFDAPSFAWLLSLQGATTPVTLITNQVYPAGLWIQNNTLFNLTVHTKLSVTLAAVAGGVDVQSWTSPTNSLNSSARTNDEYAATSVLALLVNVNPKQSLWTEVPPGWWFVCSTNVSITGAGNTVLTSSSIVTSQY